MKQKNLISFLAVAASFVLLSAPLQAEESETVRVSIADLSFQGKHFEAVREYKEHEAEATLADKLAVAKSAWALGLVEFSRDLWDETLRYKEVSGAEKYKAELSRAIMEIQEENYDKAREIAEKAAVKMPSSDIRSQLWLVIAEALREQKALSLAEGYYQKAVDEADNDLQNEARLLLSNCQYDLGRIKEARKNLINIQTNSPYAVRALQRLVDIDTEQKNYTGVMTWITEGRKRYGNRFDSERVAYAFITASLGAGDDAAAQKELDTFRLKYSEKSDWFALSRAALEAKRGEGIVRSRLKERH